MNRGLQVALWLSVALTVALFYVPYGDVIGRPLVWLSTLAHELGHGLTAVAVGGSFKRLYLYANASGVAFTATQGAWREAAVAAGGLLGPPVAAALCFVAGRNAHAARVALAAGSALMFAAAILWVRNAFGLVFVVALALCLGAAARWGGPQISRFTVVFLGVQLSLSVFSRSDYLFVSEAHTSAGVMPSDVARIADALWMPFWFWGAMCGVFSVAVLGLGLRSALVTRAPT